MLKHVLLLIAICSLTFFAGLGRPAIADSDEAFYAEAAREMVESGDWLTPHYNYEQRFQKPILFYWMAAGAYRISGISEYAARVPAALAGLGLALVTYACGRRVADETTGVLAGAIVATSFGYFSMARQALPDLPLAFFMTIATWAALEALFEERAPVRRWWDVLAAAGMAAGVLTKGPVGIILPALVAGGALLLRRPLTGAARRHPQIDMIDVLLGLVVLVALAAPWYGAMTMRHGTQYLHRFFIGENMDRFATDRYNDPRPLWFYLPIVAGGMLPWSPLMLLWVSRAARAIRQRAASVVSGTSVSLALWVVTPLAFFTASVGKQPRYILPVLPPLAILLARAIRSRTGTTGDGRSRDALVAVAGTLSGVVLILLGALIYRARPLLAAVSAGWIGLAAAAIVCSGVAIVAAAWWLRPASRLPAMVIGASVVTLVALQYAILSMPGPEPVQRIAAMLVANRHADEPSGTYRVFVRNLVFYSHVKQTDLLNEEALADFLASDQRVLAVIAQDDLAELERSRGIAARRIAHVSYFNTASLKLRTLLWPDPAHDLDTVVLISNR